MKAKALILAASFSVAAISCSFAQVYSVNAVGYVSQNVPANGLNIISVPLNGTNNQLNTVLPLPNGYDGTIIYRFDVPTQNYLDPIQWVQDFGWFSASDPSPTVNPGEGIWVQNVASTRLDVTFIGEVPSVTLNNPIPGGNQLKLMASIVPKSVKLSEIPAVDGDIIYLWDPVCQCYKDPVQYVAGFGWFSANPDDPGPDGYAIAPATGFWYQRQTAASTWTQIFSVN